MLTTYTVAKARNLWWVYDHEGYEVSYIGYDLKKDALESAKVRAYDDFAIRKEKVS